MTLTAVAFPILPGKTDEWRSFVAELEGPRHAEYAASRQRANVRERTYLQHTPMGDLVIVTLEGENPTQSFGQLMSGTDAFTTWFVARASAIHGIDLSAPMTSPPSELIADSNRVAVLAK